MDKSDPSSSKTHSNPHRGFPPASQSAYHVTMRTSQPAALPAPYDGVSDAYHRWQRQRLDSAAAAAGKIDFLALNPTNINDPQVLAELCQRSHRQSFCAWRFDQTDTPRSTVVQLLRRLGLRTSDPGTLRDDDGLALLCDRGSDPAARFIPYTNRRMNWHTDGYYNAAGQTLRCFVLHCISAAQKGGELALLDPELVLIALYKHDPELVTLLSHPQCMWLPASRDNQGHDRPERSAAVFSVHSDGCLCMRYTQRQRHIRWRNAASEQAARRTGEIIETMSGSHHTLKLQAGEGIVSRNALHQRAEFSDTEGNVRQILRGRYNRLPQPTSKDSHTDTSRTNAACK